MVLICLVYSATVRLVIAAISASCFFFFGLGSDRIFAGSGDDDIELQGTGEGNEEGEDIAYGERGDDL